MNGNIVDREQEAKGEGPCTPFKPTDSHGHPSSGGEGAALPALRVTNEGRDELCRVQKPSAFFPGSHGCSRYVLHEHWGQLVEQILRLLSRDLQEGAGSKHGGGLAALPGSRQSMQRIECSSISEWLPGTHTRHRTSF